MRFGLRPQGPCRVGTENQVSSCVEEWNSTCLSSCSRGPGQDPGLHWRRKWQPTPVFLPGESQGRGSLVGCCLWGRTEPDTTEARSPPKLMSVESVMPSNHLILCNPEIAVGPGEEY